MHPKLCAALAAWLDKRPYKRGADSSALFISVRGTRMTTDAIADVIDAITRAAGLDDHVTSHVLRHTFSTELKESQPGKEPAGLIRGLGRQAPTPGSASTCSRFRRLSCVM